MKSIELDQSFMVKNNVPWMDSFFHNPYGGEYFIILGLYGVCVGNEYHMSLTDETGMSSLPPGLEIYGDEEGEYSGVTSIHIPLVSTFFHQYRAHIDNLITQISYHQRATYILKDSRVPSRTTKGDLRVIFKYIENNLGYLKQKYDSLRNT